MNVFRGSFVAAMVKGDDGVIVTKTQVGVTDQEVINKFTKYGLTATIAPMDSAGLGEFCSSYFLHSSNGIVLSPKIGRVLAKVFWAKTIHITEEENKRRFAGIVKGLENQINHVPVLRALLDNPTFKTYHDRAIMPEHNPYGEFSAVKHEMTSTGLEQVMTYYGVSAREIKLCEEFLSTTTNFPIRLPTVFERFLQVDWNQNSTSVLIDAIPKPRSFNYNTWVFPIFEEMLRVWLGIYATIFFCLVEGSLGGVYNIVGHLVLHLINRYNPVLAIICHILHNYFVGSRDRKLNIIYMAKKVGKQRKPNARKRTNKTNPAKRMLKAAIQSGGTALGGMLGSMVGAPGIGAAIGKGGAALLANSIFGKGDYKIKRNSIVSGGGGVPIFRNGGRTIVISRREYIGDLISSVGFSSRTITINPGLSEFSNWLSGIAPSFEQYVLHGMLVEFVPTCGDAISSTNNAMGVVALATQYNVARDPFGDLIEMENTMYSNAGKPSERILHPIECEPSESTESVKYVRTGGLKANEDARFYDWGRVTIATAGMQAAGINIGQIWVTWEIELLKPISIPGGFGQPKWAHYNATSYTNNGPFDGSPVKTSGNMDLTFTTTGAGVDTVNFPTNITSGIYLVVMLHRGASTAGITTTVTPTNCSFRTLFLNGTVSNITNAGSTSVNLISIRALAITAGGAKFVLSSSTLPTSPTNAELIVIQMNSSYSGRKTLTEQLQSVLGVEHTLEMMRLFGCEEEKSCDADSETGYGEFVSTVEATGRVNQRLIRR